ncbi:hypothetical protein PsYK624_073910 [Phanerochaete sordida]|uniref:Uncharacterized protein n=1 Tax=Phanerochaete sordida TaxID=48140 RepID=A0A9P3LEQ7_9APHY|nr:hypothetical protein PsYK624_073910 [Phanerochaete sordida]
MTIAATSAPIDSFANQRARRARTGDFDGGDVDAEVYLVLASTARHQCLRCRPRDLLLTRSASFKNTKRKSRGQKPQPAVVSSTWHPTPPQPILESDADEP